MSRSKLHVTISFAMTLSLVSCTQWTRTEQPVEAGALLTVETASDDQTGDAYDSVQDMLLKNPVFFRKMMSHGHRTSTSYVFKFDGTCTTEAKLQKAVKSEIAKFVKNEVSCRDIKGNVTPKR